MELSQREDVVNALSVDSTFYSEKCLESGGKVKLEHKTLHEVFTENKKVLLHMKLLGNYWPDSFVKSSMQLLYKVVFVVVLLCVVCGTLLKATLVVDFFFQVYGSSWFVMVLALFLSSSTTLVSWYWNRKRLENTSFELDSKVLNESIQIVSYYSAAVFLMYVASFSLMACNNIQYGGYPLDLSVVVMDVFVCMYLSYNFLFLVMDLKVSSSLLDDLHHLADNKKLTMEKFLQVRTEVNRRVADSSWTSDLIIGPCVLCTIALAYAVMFIDRGARNSSSFAMVAYGLLQCKEILLVFIAFGYVAVFNARADELTKKLSRSLWSKQNSCDSSTGTGSGTGCSAVSPEVVHIGEKDAAGQMMTVVSADDVRRLSIYAASNSEPIGFTLLFKRVTWQNVAVSVGGLSISILIGLIRGFV
jgi:hypothetical protein